MYHIYCTGNTAAAETSCAQIKSRKIICIKYVQAPILYKCSNKGLKSHQKNMDLTATQD